MTLRRQLILVIGVPTLVIYLAILGAMAFYTYHESKDAQQRMMMQLASSYASRFDGHLREAARVAETTAAFVEGGAQFTDEQIYEQLEREVRQSNLIFGAALAFEPGTRKAADALFAPYVCRTPDDNGLRQVNIDRSVYDWYADPKYTWYSRPKSLGHGVWSEPYFDEGAGNVLMTTYSAPFRASEKFGGVATVDLDLPQLHKTLGYDFQEDFQFFILAADGRFVYDVEPTRILAKTIFDVAQQEQRPELAALGQRMLEGSAGIEMIDGWDSPQRQWVFFAPIRSTQWVFAVRFPESAVLADVRRRTIWSTLALGATLLMIIGCIAVAARVVSAPITRLKDKVLEVGQGDLDATIDETSSTDEIRQLSTSFNRMTSELRHHVDRLAVERAARARIEYDLDIAREIQVGLLPTAKPDVANFEFAGWSRPADKTGGDYYDWQTAPDGKTLVTLADVTGHGVGPALVTAVCRAYVRASFLAGRELSGLMSHLNDLLVADLPDNRFVTCVAAMFDPATGSLEMVSAGHGPTFLYRAADKTLAEYNADDLPLGVASPLAYAPTVKLDLAPGDLLFMLTDGFFEWKDQGGKEFGLDRLRQAVIAVAESPIDQLISNLYAIVESFAGGNPRDDDATAVVVRRMVGQ